MFRTATVLVLTSAIGLSACNTVKGVSKDLYGGTKYVAKKAIGSDRRDEE